MGGKKMPDSTDAQNFRIQYSKTNIYEISESTTYFKIITTNSHHVFTKTNIKLLILRF